MFETIWYLSDLCSTPQRHTNMLVAVISLKLWLRDQWTNCNVLVSLNAFRKLV